ncbi:MAG: ABC transporter ATP-binding protein [Candidatus Doudnabacteria bacterium]|nr:ABC transporter ATP-binding protein [Candidatus Doudnabacteria bacterium]
MSIIEVKNLNKAYNGTQAVRGITFSVEKGEIYGILGPNGAGKTTTLEILEGLKSPDSGQAEMFGLEVAKNNGGIKKRIGVQLQHSEYLPALSLKELLELFAALYHKRVDSSELLNFVGLGSKVNSYVNELSGGQKQRFTLASALVNEPEVLFLDEPTTGLDPRARRDVWELIRQINSKGITVVLTTHYMEEAEYLCHRVAIMEQGKILKISEPKKLIEEIANTSQVSFFTSDNVEESWWKQVPEVEKVYSNYPKVILEINSLDSVSKILSVLKAHNVSFSGFSLKTATLEDVYLDLTGKEFESES